MVSKGQTTKRPQEVNQRVGTPDYEKIIITVIIITIGLGIFLILFSVLLIARKGNCIFDFMFLLLICIFKCLLGKKLNRSTPIVVIENPREEKSVKNSFPYSKLNRFKGSNLSFSSSSPSSGSNFHYFKRKPRSIDSDIINDVCSIVTVNSITGQAVDYKSSYKNAIQREPKVNHY